MSNESSDGWDGTLLEPEARTDSPGMRGSAGLILELRMHDLLPCCQEPFPVQAIPLKTEKKYHHFKSEDATPSGARAFSRENIRYFTSTMTLIGDCGLDDKTYYIPDHSKYPFLDSFVFDSNTFTISFFQVMVAAKSHGMKIKELNKITSALSKWMPHQTFKFEYFTVVPRGEKPVLKLARLWRGEIKVFLLEVDIKTLRMSDDEDISFAGNNPTMRTDWLVVDREESESEDEEEFEDEDEDENMDVDAYASVFL